MYYVYMLRCQDGKIYMGITDDTARHFKEHVHGKGGCYTNYNRPDAVSYKEICRGSGIFFKKGLSF